MSQRQHTLKLPGYQPTTKPAEDDELEWWRNFLKKIIFGLWNQKRQWLKQRGMPPQPVHQKEIRREVANRIFHMKQAGIWNHREHDHNWIERRVNELATQEYGPKTEDGTLMIVNVTAGKYAPNPELFEDST